MKKTFIKIISILFISLLINCGVSEKEKKHKIYKKISTAIKSDNLKEVKKTLSSNFDINYQAGQLLADALANGNLQIVKFLLSKGAKINARVENKNSAKMNPFQSACTSIEDPKILHDYIKFNKVKLSLDYIISKGANIENRDWQGNTPIITSIQFGKKNLFKYLLSKGANINVKNKKGHGALYFANKHSGYEMIPIVVDALNKAKK